MRTSEAFSAALTMLLVACAGPEPRAGSTSDGGGGQGGEQQATTVGQGGTTTTSTNTTLGVGGGAGGSAPEPGLVTLLAFEEGSGFLTFDESPSELVGQLEGPTWQSGTLSFDGEDDLVSFGLDGPRVSLPFTVTARVFLLGPFGPNSMSIVATNHAGLTGAPFHGIWLGINQNGAVSVQYGDSGNYNRTYSQQAVEAGQWIDIAAVYHAPGDAQIFIEGDDVETIQTGTALEVIHNSTYEMTVGWTYATFFRGQIDEVRIYDRALLASEIQTLDR